MPGQTTHTSGLLAESASVPAWLAPYLPSLLNLAFGILILLVGWVVSKWTAKAVRSGLRRVHLEEALSRSLSSIAQYCVLAAATIAALNRWGMQTTSLIAVLASAGLAVGLALQGSLSNFASGVMIFFFRPFVLGDDVKVAGSEGSVEDIGMFQTTLHADDGEIIILPNSTVTSDPVINYSTAGLRRATMEARVVYGCNIETVLDHLKRAVVKVPDGLHEPQPIFRVSALGPSSLGLQVGVWCPANDYDQVLSDLRAAVYEGLTEAGIGIALPHLVLHRAEPLAT